MEQVQWSTPIKSEINHHNSPMKSPACHRTPKNQNESKHRQTAYQNSTGGFTVLPNHITPPSGFTKFIARNPFEANLTNRLHLSVISPTVFSKQGSSPLQDSPRFVWSVEELALIKPASIEESPIQQLHCSDPELEIKAQAAINRFFCENRIVPSPWDSKRKDVKKIEMSTPSRPQEDLNSTRDSHKSKKDSSAQTVLSLPSKLPEELEEALKPYFTFTQEQHIENDEANLSNSSLRRKLFFNQEDSREDEQYSSMSLSPVRSHNDTDLGVNCSPTQSGMLLEGFSLQRSLRKVQRNHGTPTTRSGNLSPPNMSPIANSHSDMSCQSIKSRVSRSVARLDFTTDMSIEASITEEKKTDDNNEPSNSVLSFRSTLGSYSNLPRGTSMLHTEFSSSTEDVEKLTGFDELSKKTKQNETVEMILLGEETTPVKCTEKADGVLPLVDHRDIINRLKFAAEWCKIHSNESYVNQNNTVAGISGQQSTFNFAQDTGYQTYSMNSTSMTENVNVTPSKQIMKWEERILPNDDELQMSDWKKNMMNVYSSTPSKNRDRDN